jgi:hypothetical protein
MPGFGSARIVKSVLKAYSAKKNTAGRGSDICRCLKELGYREHKALVCSRHFCQAGLKDIPPHLVAFGESSAFFFCHSCCADRRDWFSIEIYGVEIWQAYTDQNEVPSHSVRAKGQRATFHGSGPGRRLQVNQSYRVLQGTRRE